MTKCDVSVSAAVDIEIPFHDGDPMGVTWHGNYFRYLEIARCALLDKLDFSYVEMERSGFMWPVVDTRLKFVRPTIFGQRVRVMARLEEYENRLKVSYEITDIESGDRVTKGYTTQLAVDKQTNELCFCSPQVLIEKVRKCA